MFHVKHTFLEEWRRYQRALRQRNAVLRQTGGREEAAVWEDALIASGHAIDQLRQTYLDELAPHIARMTTALLDDRVEIVYQRGWADGMALDQALSESWDRDARLGQTHVGPQRADLRLRFADRLARDRVSRGQQKLLAASLVLAQVVLVSKHGAKPPVLLLDDPAAELDNERLGRLLTLTSELSIQQIVTALDPTAWPVVPDGHMFHVEQGNLRLML